MTALPVFAIAALLLQTLVAARDSIGGACEPLSEFAADRVALDVDARSLLLTRCVLAAAAADQLHAKTFFVFFFL